MCISIVFYIRYTCHRSVYTHLLNNGTIELEIGYDVSNSETHFSITLLLVCSAHLLYGAVSTVVKVFDVDSDIDVIYHFHNC